MAGFAEVSVISVCVPVHNGARFLPRLFSCLADQLYRDFEVVVVDDGSTDGSADVAERLLAHHGLRGRVIRTPNQGSARARDLACSSARAAIIATLDCDDWWEPNYLADMVAALGTHPGTDLVYCDLLEIFPDGRTLLKSKVATWIELSRATRNGDVYGFARGAFFSMMLSGQVLFPSCTMYTRELYRRTGGYAAVLPDLPTSLDWSFGLRAARTGSVAFLNRPLLRKYVRVDSVSNASFVKTESSTMRILEELLRDSTLQPDERRIGRRYGALVSSWCAYESWATHKKQIEAMKWAYTSLRFWPNWDAAKVAVKSLIPRSLVDWVRSGRPTFPRS